MTADLKTKMLIAGSSRTPSDVEIIEALGRGAAVQADNGTAVVRPPQSMTLGDLQRQLRAMKVKASRRRGQVTPPITGGHHNGRRRNEACHCGSGRKWKKCCGAPVQGEQTKLVAMPPKRGM